MSPHFIPYLDYIRWKERKLFFPLLPLLTFTFLDIKSAMPMERLLVHVSYYCIHKMDYTYSFASESYFFNSFWLTNLPVFINTTFLGDLVLKFWGKIKKGLYIWLTGPIKGKTRLREIYNFLLYIHCMRARRQGNAVWSNLLITFMLAACSHIYRYTQFFWSVQKKSAIWSIV